MLHHVIVVQLHIMKEAVNQGAVTARSRVAERLRLKNPEIDLEDDEVLYSGILDQYDHYDKEAEDYKAREQRMLDLFSKDPRSAAFFNDWQNGGDPLVALVRQFGSDGLKEALEDPERQDELAEAHKEWLERKVKSEELEAEYQANIDASLEMADALCQEHGLSEEEFAQVVQFLQTIFSEFLVGKWNKETLLMAINAIKHDEHVATAEHNALVDGRNSKIDEAKVKKKKGDGMPQIPVGGGAVPRSNRRSLGALDRFSDTREDIYDRGGGIKVVN